VKREFRRLQLDPELEENEEVGKYSPAAFPTVYQSTAAERDLDRDGGRLDGRYFNRNVPSMLALDPH